MSRSRLVRLLLALLLFAGAAWLLRGYVTDDTFIHLRYARNLVERGEFAFNPGHATYGATSPLWILGLALLLKLGVAPLAAAWALGAAGGLLVILLADALLDRLTCPEVGKGLLLLLIAADAWFLRWTFSGMETPLATALLLLLLWPLVSGRDLGWGTTRGPLWRRYLAWGLVAGLAGLTRPELLLVAPAALPALLWFEYFRAGDAGGVAARYRARPYAPLAAAAGGWAAVVVPWLVFAWSAFGRLLPGTVTAKSAALTLSPLAVGGNLVHSLQQLAVTQGGLWVTTLLMILLILLRNSAGELRPVDWDGTRNRYRVEPAVGPVSDGWSVWGPVALVLVAATWAVLLLGGYALKQVWIISRYVSPLAPVLVLAMGVIIEWLHNGTRAGQRYHLLGRWIILGGAALTVASNVWIFSDRVVPHARRFPAGVKECYLGLGDWLRENSDPDAVVAALDIGAVGWASERQVLDLMGLVSPEVLALGSRMGFQEMVASGAWLRAEGRRPDYLVDRCEGEPRWAGRSVGGVRFELLDSCIIEGVGLREPQPWTVSLYRLVSASDSLVRSSAGG